MSFAPYASYVQSTADWLGSIPMHWSTARVKTLFEIRKRIARELGHDVLSVTQQGLKVRDIDSNDGQLSMDYSKYQLVEPGDFVMNHMDLLTGWVDVSQFHGVTSPDYRVFTAREKELSLRFFLYLFQNGYQQRIFYAFGQGASGFGRWRMPTDSFNDFILPVPPLSEQTAIVNFLDRETAKIDALVEEQRRLSELLKEKRKAVVSHTVVKGLDPNAPLKDSGIKWLGEVPAHWRICRLKHVAGSDGIQMGPFGGMLKDLRSEPTGYKVYGQENTIRGDFSLGTRWLDHHRYCELGRYSLEPGDLVITRKGSIGSCRLFPEDADPGIADSDTIRLRFNKAEIVAPFALWLLHDAAYVQTQFSIKKRGAILAGLNTEVVSNLVVAVPPIDEQHAMLSRLQQESEGFLRSLEDVDAAIQLLQERRAALISAAVTGKIDVHRVVRVDAPLLDVVAA